MSVKEEILEKLESFIFFVRLHMRANKMSIHDEDNNSHYWQGSLDALVRFKKTIINEIE